jgi:hypothetical protein
MAKMKELDRIARGVADITKELMYDSVHWQLEDYPQEGDTYNAITVQPYNNTVTYLSLPTSKW